MNLFKKRSRYEKKVFVLFFGFNCSLTIGQEVKSLSTGSYDREEEVVTFMKKAMDYAKLNGKKEVLKEFINRDGEFIEDELYIYAYDFNGTVISRGGQPELVGKNLISMTDTDGVQVIKELIKLAKQGSGRLEYLWPNPEHGNKIESKVGYVMKVDSTWFLGSGVYR